VGVVLLQLLLVLLQPPDVVLAYVQVQLPLVVLFLQTLDLQLLVLQLLVLLENLTLQAHELLVYRVVLLQLPFEVGQLALETADETGILLHGLVLL
jgi:hypothetical protein